MKSPLSRLPKLPIAALHQTLFAAARCFLSGSLLSKSFGVVREVALASAFGAGADIASFMVAFRLAHFFRRFIGESGLAVAFIPHFEALKERSPAGAAHFFVRMSLALKGLLALLTLAVCFGFYSASKLAPVAWQEVFSLAALISSSLFFIGLYALNQAFLQTSGRFFIGSAAPIAFNILFAGGAALAHTQTYFSPIIFLSLMAVLGLAAQWIVTCPGASAAHAQLQASGGPVTDSKGVGRSIAKASFLGLLGLAAVQINNVVDGIFAKVADPRAPAYLWYAMRVYQLPLSLFAVSLANALLPTLSKYVGEEEVFTGCLRAACKKIIGFMVPVTGAMLILAPTGLSVLYGHGHFDVGSIVMTSYCLLGYGFGLVASCFVVVFAQAFYALKDYRTPSIAALFSVLLNIALNAFFIFYWELGGPGVACATALAAWFNAAWLKGRMKTGSLVDKAYLLKVLFATVLSCGVVLLWSVGKRDFSSKILLGLTEGLTMLPFLVQLKALIFKTAAFGLVFFILTRRLEAK